LIVTTSSEERGSGNRRGKGRSLSEGVGRREEEEIKKKTQTILEFSINLEREEKLVLFRTFSMLSPLAEGRRSPILPLTLTANKLSFANKSCLEFFRWSLYESMN
jgi:hypothetical protein